MCLKCIFIALQSEVVNTSVLGYYCIALQILFTHKGPVFLSCISHFLNCISQLVYTGVLSWLCTIIILTCARKQAAQVALTHMKNKLENALETNSNLQISNLVRVQI